MIIADLETFRPRSSTEPVAVQFPALLIDRRNAVCIEIQIRWPVINLFDLLLSLFSLALVVKGIVHFQQVCLLIEARQASGGKKKHLFKERALPQKRKLPRRHRAIISLFRRVISC